MIRNQDELSPEYDFRPLKFFSEEIQVIFNKRPVFTKRPDAPNAFIHNGQRFSIRQVLSQWHSFERKGRMALNMKTPHLESARRKGSWGVGRFYFRIQTEKDRYFDLYYDRAPELASDRQGHWFLWRELEKLS
ncbi:MAG: hypothetical protein JXA25_00875 [Anaerolineales bacterium]|nr:hypothetical protein [Anaerolineales bacterium]